MGLLGIGRGEFDFLCPREIWIAFKAIAEERDKKMIIDYNGMRLQTLYLFNMGRKTIDQIEDPRIFMPFPWDKKFSPLEVHIPSEDEWLKMDEKYAPIMEKEEKKRKGE